MIKYSLSLHRPFFPHKNLIIVLVLQLDITWVSNTGPLNNKSLVTYRTTIIVLSFFEQYFPQGKYYYLIKWNLATGNRKPHDQHDIPAAYSEHWLIQRY